MSGPDDISLEEYVEQNPVRGKCWVCNCEYRAKLEEVFRKKGPGSIAPMVRWLKERKGVKEATDSRFRHHFIREKHHEQG